MLGYVLLSPPPTATLGGDGFPVWLCPQGAGVLRGLSGWPWRLTSLKQGQDPALPPHPGVIAGYSPRRRPSRGVEEFSAEAGGSGIWGAVLLFSAPGKIKVGLPVWAHQGPN